MVLRGDDNDDVHLSYSGSGDNLEQSQYERSLKCRRSIVDTRYQKLQRSKTFTSQHYCIPCGKYKLLIENTEIINRPIFGLGDLCASRDPSAAFLSQV